jgi:hypothetical protein
MIFVRKRKTRFKSSKFGLLIQMNGEWPGKTWIFLATEGTKKLNIDQTELVFEPILHRENLCRRPL